MQMQVLQPEARASLPCPVLGGGPAVVQAGEELGEEDEQEVADEQEEVERREGAEEERRRRRRHHCVICRLHAGRGSGTEPVQVQGAGADADAEAMRRSLRAKHLLQHRHTGTPAAAARIAHLRSPRARGRVVLLERGALSERKLSGSCGWTKRRTGRSNRR